MGALHHATQKVRMPVTAFPCTTCERLRDTSHVLAGQAVTAEGLYRAAIDKFRAAPVLLPYQRRDYKLVSRQLLMSLGCAGLLRGVELTHARVGGPCSRTCCTHTCCPSGTAARVKPRTC